jgi:hypothetical protein
MLTVVAQGLVAAAPPGRPVDEVIAALEAVAPDQGAALSRDETARRDETAQSAPAPTAAGVR